MADLSKKEWEEGWASWNKERGAVAESAPKSESVPQYVTRTEPEETPLRCPNCRSTYITANKKGFGLGKALVGGVLTGGVGLLAGFIGSGKVKCTCLKCGYEWKP